MANSKDVPLKETLVALLEQRGWSIARLSKEAKVPRATLSGWIHGASPTGSFEPLLRVSRILGVSFQFLCVGHDDQDPSSIIKGAARTTEMEGFYYLKLEKVQETR